MKMSHSPARLALLGAFFLANAGAGICACEDSSGGGTALPDAAPSSPFLVDGGGPGPEGGAVDAALADAAPAADGGGDAGIPPNPGRIVNLARTPALLDVCFSKTEGNFSGTPFLKSRGLPGVPSGGMSAPFVVTADAALSSDTYFRVIDATTGVCPGVTFPGGLLGVPLNGLFVYTGGIIQGSDAVSYVLSTPMAGKDTVGLIMADPPRLATFVPNGGGAAVPIVNSPVENRIDPSVSGEVVVHDDPPAGDVTRAFKPLAGGLVYLLAYPEKTIACDLLAAPAAGLTPCGADVRAP